MAKIDFPKKQEQRLIPKYLLEYAEELQENHPDPSAEWGGGSGGEYTAGTGIDITDNVISVDNTIETKANATNRFVSKANLTDYSINQIIVGNSDIDNDNVDLRAVYSQDVKSEISLDPTSTIIRTMSGTDTSTIGISSTEIDVTTPLFKYGTSEVATHSYVEDYVEAHPGPQGPAGQDGLTTSITVNGSTYTQTEGNITLPNYPTVPTNYVTTNTSQTITGEKTFTNKVTFAASNNNYKFTFKGYNPIQMIAPSTSTTGFTLFNSNNDEKGYFQYNARSNQDALYLGRYSSSSTTPTYAQNLGFLSEAGSTGYRILIPNKTNVSGGATQAANTYYIPTEITDGTTTIKATSEGVVNISSLLPTVPTKTSDLTNDSGFITGITSGMVTTALGYTPGTSNFSGDYTDLTNKPTIPSTATSTSTVTPTTETFTFTYDDDTTATITVLTGASVSTTTTLS